LHAKQLVIVLLWLVLFAAQAHGQESPGSVLEKCCAITAQDLTTLNKGQAIGRLIKLGEDTAQFDVPPRPADVATFVVDTDQIKLLKECKPGNCGFKFSIQEIARSRAELDWKSPNVVSQAEALVKNILLQHGARYMEQGDSVLPKYNDKPEEVDVLATFRTLLEASPYIKTAFPELFAQLSQYRGIEESANRDEMIYWSREHYGFGLKPLINVTHTMFYKASPSVTVIAAKQIWANHYNDGSLGITVLADANPGTYFVYLNRSRIDLLRSAGFKRWLVRRFAPGAIRKEVVALKRQVEAKTLPAR